MKPVYCTLDIRNMWRNMSGLLDYLSYGSRHSIFAPETFDAEEKRKRGVASNRKGRIRRNIMVTAINVLSNVIE